MPVFLLILGTADFLFVQQAFNDGQLRGPDTFSRPLKVGLGKAMDKGVAQTFLALCKNAQLFLSSRPRDIGGHGGKYAGLPGRNQLFKMWLASGHRRRAPL